MLSMNWMKLDNQIAYIWSFIKEHNLLNKDSQTILAMSGGVDSQVLGHIFKQFHRIGFLKNPPLALHINHKTRTQKEHLIDLECVKEIYPNCFVKTINIANKTEYAFRIQRNKIYKSLASSYNAKIITAHHLDDAFEWSMMQSFKSSNLESTLGIPIKNKFMIRPLMCLSKKQIRNYALAHNLKYHEDSTSKNINIERNNFRTNILPSIKSRYPNYLEHFVRRSRQLQVTLKDKKVKAFYDHGNYHLHELVSISSENLKNSIKELSTNNRGMLAREVEKLLKAIKNKKSGPMSFSGGVYAYIFNTFILITNQKVLKIPNLLTQKKMNYYQFDHFLRARKGHGISEQFIFVENVKFSSKVNHPILSAKDKSKKMVESLHFRNKWQKQHKFRHKQLEFSVFK